ncbi:hypothetical protein [Thalassoroseus pseudoceratinae]|uniref:hypothetical protein n=1 Tax=Thalassoroseus pseudoceratinae TaxID=2713176 RepID=UPI001424161F|nr:hypothetical protein [Thalassoroseus pseudoceratinae]
MDREPVRQTNECHRCGASTDVEPILPLWDGHAYCEACLKAHSQTLYSAAKSGLELEETMPFSPWTAFGQSFLFYWLSTNLTFGGLMFWFAFRRAGWEGAVEALLAMQVFFAPMCLLYSVAQALGYRLGRPRVFVNNGHLTIRLGNQRSEYASLSKVEWYLGPSWHTTFGGKKLYPNASALLLVFPGDEYQEYRASVGFTEESRKRWIDFLTFIDLPRRTAWEHRFAWKWVANVAGAAMLFLGPAAWFLGMKSAKPVFTFLFHDPDLAARVLVTIAMFGAFYIFLYVAALWPWNAHPRGPSRKPHDEQQKQHRAVRWGFFLVFGAYTSIYALTANGADWVSRIVAMLFLWTIFGIACDLLARKIATTEPIRRIDDESASGALNGDSL